MSQPAAVLVDSHGRPLRAQATAELLDTAHRGASLRSRELASWLASMGSADADLLPELPTLAARGRDLDRNHGVAAGSVQTLVDNIVGTGLRLAARPDYKALGRDKAWADAWAQATEAKFRSWADTPECDAARQLTFAGQTRLVCRTAIVQGEALALPLWLDGRRWSTCLQLVDPDRLSNPRGMPDTSSLRGGIEQDAYGAPVAYHIRRTHPFELHGIGPMVAAGEWERIPAMTPWGRRRVLHVYDKQRTGQSRGKPLMTAIMPMFRMLDHYERSELQAAVVNAMIAAFIETPLEAHDLVEMFGGSTEKYLERRGQWQVQLRGGAIIPTFPGDKLAPFTPARPNAAFGDFTTNVLRHIGTALGLPLELLMKDFSKTNYSSARAALLEAWRYFTGRRAWLVTHWATPCYLLWLEEAVNRGEIEAPGFYDNPAAWSRCEWIGDGRGWVDPLKEAQASRERRDGLVSTLQRECAEQGLDWEEVLEQVARERQRMAELGLTEAPRAAVLPAAEDAARA